MPSSGLWNYLPLYSSQRWWLGGLSLSTTVSFTSIKNNIILLVLQWVLALSPGWRA
jgi:hypothetical protein